MPRSDAELRQVMIQVLVATPAALVCTHVPEQRMLQRSWSGVDKGIDRGKQSQFFQLKVAVTRLNILRMRTYILGVPLVAQNHLPDQPSEYPDNQRRSFKSLAVRHFLNLRAMPEQLRGVHRSPLGYRI